MGGDVPARTHRATRRAELPHEQFVVDAEPAFLLFGVGVLEGQQALDEDRFSRSRR